MKFISSQIKSFLFLLLLFHSDIIEFRARASSFSVFNSLSNEHHSSRKKLFKHSSSKSKLSPSSVKFDICSATRKRSNAVSGPAPTAAEIVDWVPETRERGKAIDFTKLLGDELFCKEDSSDAMKPRLRFYVKTEFTPFGKEVTTKDLNIGQGAHLGDDPSATLSDKVLEKLSFILEFGFTVIHQGGKKFDFEPIVPYGELMDSIAKWVAEKIVYPKPAEKTTFLESIKTFYETHKEQFKKKLIEAGKNLLKAIGKSILKWLVRFVLGSVILALFPYLAPLVLVYQIVNILLKFRNSKKQPNENGTTTYLLSYILGAFDHFGEITINLELTAHFGAIKKLFQNLAQGLKARLQKCVDWLKTRFSKFVSWIKGKDSQEMEKNLEDKLDKESKGEIEHDTSILDNNKIKAFDEKTEIVPSSQDTAGTEESLETEEKLNFE